LLKASARVATETGTLVRFIYMKTRTIFLLAGTAVAASVSWSCAEGRLVGIPSEAVQLSDAEVQVLFAAQTTGLQERQRAVLHTQQEWAELWDRAHANLLPAPTAPSLDFGQQRVVVATMGGRSSGGYSIRIDGVYRQGSDLYVRVHQVSPGAACVVTAALTAPATAVSVPRTDGKVHFVDSSETRAC
jgi:hypothetical protein